MKIEFNNQIYEVGKTTGSICDGCFFIDTNICPRYLSNGECIFPDNQVCIDIVSSQLFEL